MTRQHSGPEKARGIPLSAVYRQLDDHLSADAADYDPAVIVTRMLATWPCTDPSRSLEGAARRSDSQDLMLQLGQRRLTGAIASCAAILGISGLAFATVLVSGLTSATLVGVGAVAVLFALTVVVTHSVTMRSMTADQDRFLRRSIMAGRFAEGATRLSRRHTRRPTDFTTAVKPPRRRRSIPVSSAAAVRAGTACVVLCAGAAGAVLLDRLHIASSAVAVLGPALVLATLLVWAAEKKIASGDSLLEQRRIPERLPLGQGLAEHERERRQDLARLMVDYERLVEYERRRQDPARLSAEHGRTEQGRGQLLQYMATAQRLRMRARTGDHNDLGDVLAALVLVDARASDSGRQVTTSPADQQR